jgi:hypothetical protein
MTTGLLVAVYSRFITTTKIIDTIFADTRVITFFFFPDIQD